MTVGVQLGHSVLSVTLSSSRNNIRFYGGANVLFSFTDSICEEAKMGLMKLEPEHLYSAALLVNTAVSGVLHNNML